MEKFREIGGYFELELAHRDPWHGGLFEFNTLRNGIYILIGEMLKSQPKKSVIYMPRFLCPEVSEKIITGFRDIKIINYSIGESLLPEISIIPPDGIIYIYNVFGLLSQFLDNFAGGAIFDHAHAFYAPSPTTGSHALYSARKFFGVPDGAYIATDENLDPLPPQPVGKGAVHLFKRLDLGATAAYPDYLNSERHLANASPAGMSTISRRILEAIDHDFVRVMRQTNFLFLHEKLFDINELSCHINSALSRDSFVPYSYPLMVENGHKIRNFLNAERIFNPKLWAGIDENSSATMFEKRLAKDVVHLPIDQRYGISEMIYINAKINEALVK